MGFVYSECASVEHLLHPKASSSERTPLSPDSYTAEGDYLCSGGGSSRAGWTQRPSPWKMPGFKYKEHSWVWRFLVSLAISRKPGQITQPVNKYIFSDYKQKASWHVGVLDRSPLNSNNKREALGGENSPRVH